MVAPAMADVISIDAGVLEELLQALLEVAARKDALRSWPKGSAPEHDPPVQARRDDDGTLGVFRFFTIRESVGSIVLDPVRDMTADEARAKIDGVDKLKPGDEVGVELPLGRLAAIALADVVGVGAGKVHLLPPRIVEMLGDEGLADAVSARLSALRGPPHHVPLRRLVTDFGGDAVEWTAVCTDGSSGGDEEDGEGAGELVVLVERGDEHKLVVVPSATSAAGHASLLRALAPIPDDQSLWRFLEVEGPALLCGAEGALWSEPSSSSRLSLEVKSIAIARDPTVYGVARARARLLSWAGDKIVEEQEALIGLPVDLPRFVDQAWPEGEALERVRAAAAAFRADLQHKLGALAQRGAVTVDDALGGAAFLRVLARAAAGGALTTAAEPPRLREVEDGAEDEIGLRVADLGVLVLSPADDVVKLRSGDEDRDLFVDGGVVDGDPAAWRAFTEAFGQAVIDAGLDVELVLSEGEGDDDAETVMLSAWLISLGEREPLRWVPHKNSADAAAALHVLVDRFVDVGPESER